MKNHLVKGVIVAMLLSMTIMPFSINTVYAKKQSVSVEGKQYEFGEKDDYPISSGTSSTSISGSGQFGTFSISGDIKAIPDVNGIDAYEVVDGVVELNYDLKKTLIDADETNWHLIDDKSKKIDTEKLDENILKGAIIVQTSLDGQKWITDVTKTNIAGEETEFTSNIYESKAVQQVNGCFYRIIVVYKTEQRLADTKFGPITSKHYDYKRIAETYEFYLIDSFENSSKATKPDVTPRKELGKRIKTGKNDGYSGNEQISDKDPHFGWDIGTFYLNGYTREQPVSGSNETIFLKTLGDRVTLWFNLKEDITCLHGNKDLCISEDKDSYDQYFGVEKTNFKHGALIIQFTDHEGKKHDPVIYTDYLAANVKTGANTRVELFEEGDYEVALNYEIKDSSGVFDTYTNYRIFFTFKIRNGNCMVYPFDIKTGNELADNALTENGFKLDLARSRYLTVDIVRNAVKNSNGKFSLDTRVNTATQEGKEYTSEGIYTFTVKNPSTGDSTTKTIYVGSSPIYKALSDGHTIDEVNNLISQGGELQDNGYILMPIVEEPKKPEESEEPKETEEPKQTEEPERNEEAIEDEKVQKESMIESANVVQGQKGESGKQIEEAEETIDKDEEKKPLEAEIKSSDSILPFVILGIVVIAVILGLYFKRKPNIQSGQETNNIDK